MKFFLSLLLCAVAVQCSRVRRSFPVPDSLTLCKEDWDCNVFPGTKCRTYQDTLEGKLINIKQCRATENPKFNRCASNDECPGEQYCSSRTPSMPEWLRICWRHSIVCPYANGCPEIDP